MSDSAGLAFDVDRLTPAPAADGDGGVADGVSVRRPRSARSVLVGDYGSLAATDAIGRVRGVGLCPAVERAVTGAPEGCGRVVGQEPAAGEVLLRGQIVQLFVGESSDSATAGSEPSTPTRRDDRASAGHGGARRRKRRASPASEAGSAAVVGEVSESVWTRGARAREPASEDYWDLPGASGERVDLLEDPWLGEAPPQDSGRGTSSSSLPVEHRPTLEESTAVRLGISGAAERVAGAEEREIDDGDDPAASLPGGVRHWRRTRWTLATVGVLMLAALAAVMSVGAPRASRSTAPVSRVAPSRIAITPPRRPPRRVDAARRAARAGVAVRRRGVPERRPSPRSIRARRAAGTFVPQRSTLPSQSQSQSQSQSPSPSSSPVAGTEAARGDASASSEATRVAPAPAVASQSPGPAGAGPVQFFRP